MSSSLDLTDAKAALARSRRRENPAYEEVDAEPADPSYINHEDRRSTRLLEPASDTQLDLDHIPDPLLECGCQEGCPDHVDPLGPNSMFKLYAANVCESPRPMTLEKARKVYLSYKRAEMNREGHTSDLEYVKGLYGNIMDAERQLMDEIDSPSTLFLSLRQSPIREDAGRREWISPLRLCERLHSPWKRVYDALRDGTSEFRTEYLTVKSFTSSCATPHMHILWYVEDPDDELSLEVGKTAVRRYVDGNPLASMEYHPVNEGQSDAAVIEHDVSRGCDRVDESNYADVLEHRDHRPFKPNSEALIYMMSQLSSFVLANVFDGSSDIHRTSPLVDAAVVDWASTYDTWTSSMGFPY